MTTRSPSTTTGDRRGDRRDIDRAAIDLVWKAIRRPARAIGRSPILVGSDGGRSIGPTLHPSVDPALGLGRSCVASTESKRSMPVSSVAVSAEIEPQPTVAPITEGAALIKNALESALESWRVGAMSARFAGPYSGSSPSLRRGSLVPRAPSLQAETNEHTATLTRS